ncbi:unnamed protein product, partial [Closterium sp. NIES-54]
AVDLSNQRASLKLACKMEAAQQIWIRQLQTAREPYLTHTLGGSYLSTSSREIMRLEENLERVASCLAAIRRMWPDLPQTTLDLAKIAFNRDIGKAVLESYSRVLEGAASNIRARLRDVLHADHLFNNPQLFPLQDAPSDPRPQHLRHPTFSLLMPDTIFDAVSVSGGSESSASIRSFESSRSGSSGKGGRHFRGGSMVSDSGVSSPGGGGGGSGGSGGISGGKSGGGRWDTRPPRSPELRTSSVAPAGMSRLGGNGSGGNGSSGMSFRDRFRSATLAAPTSSAAAATTAGAAADAAGGAVGGAAAAGPGSGAMGYSQSLPAHDPKQQQQQPYLRRTGSFQPTSQSRGGMMRTVRRSQSGGLEEEVMRLKLESGETGGDSPVLTKTPGIFPYCLPHLTTLSSSLAHPVSPIIPITPPKPEPPQADCTPHAGFGAAAAAASTAAAGAAAGTATGATTGMGTAAGAGAGAGVAAGAEAAGGAAAGPPVFPFLPAPLSCFFPEAPGAAAGTAAVAAAAEEAAELAATA